jgi:uncharacterized protein involved in exopolysaccharide biosynthesis
MMETQFESSGSAGGGGWFLNHLLTILWDRRLFILLPFLVILACSAIAAYTLPTYYRSTATLLVQSADLPSDVAGASTGTDVENRIAKIREQVLSRGDLIRLIEQDDLYTGERRDKPMSYVVDKMRKATTVGALSGDIGQTGTSKDNTIAVSLSFDYPDPGKAQAVMQEYVTQFLRKDSDQSQDQADVAVRFLQDEATKLQSQIQQIESRVTALKAQNGAALAGTGIPLVMDTGSYTSQIADLENQNRQLLAQSGRSENPELVQAEAALAKAEATYSDRHPDVVQARERVAELKRATAGSSDNSVVQQQIQANNGAIASLRAARDQAIAKTNTALAGQARAPAILEQASQLESQANGLRDQYKQVADNLLKAQASARLAAEQRGERLSLVEPANLPDHPQWPNRPLLIAAGAAVGIVVGILLALAVELLNRPLRSPAQIEALDLPVLGLVPAFDSLTKKKRFRLRRKLERRVA